MSQEKPVFYAEPGVATHELIPLYADDDYDNFVGILASFVGILAS